MLLAILKKHGVRYICGLPAAQIGLFMDGASRDPDLVYITTRHEEAAGHMAASISRVTNTLGVCFATVGPGATNLVPGVAAAFADNIPIVVITGQNQARAIEPSIDQLQSADQLGLFRSITKWNAVIHHPERAPELIERAIHIARSGRPGPVHLDIPCDVGTQLCHYDLNQVPPYRPQRPRPSQEELQRVVAALRCARKPLLVAGGGVARSGGVSEFRTLVARTDMLAMATANGRGVLLPNDPNTLGSAGLVSGQAAIDASQEADLVLAIGCKFSTFTPIHKPPHYPKPDHQKIIQIEIDAESIGKAAPVEIGLVGDAKATLAALLEEMGQSLEYKQDMAWKQSILERRDADRELYRDSAKQSKVVGGSGLLNESAVAAAISRLLPEDAIVVHDGGQTMMWTLSHIQVDSPERSLFVPGMGHLGFGLPYANAAKLAHPERAVFCLTGDGAMGMTVQELETASRYGLEIVVVVFNDSYWGMYKPFGEMLDNPEFGTRLSTVDFATVARGFGCYAEDVTDLGEIPAAIGRAMNSGKPSVINIGVDFTPHPMDFLWPNIILDGFQFPEVPGNKLKAVA
jgi:acetolactate synthase-1/2/3 large subunit